MNTQVGFKIISLSSILVLTACGSSGGSDTPVNNDLGGIWNGTVISTDGAESSIGLISEAGKLFFLTDDELVLGSVGTSENDFNGTADSYSPEGVAIGGKFSGTFTARSIFSGSASYQGTQTSTFTYTYDDAHARGSSFDAVAGTYSETEGGYTETYTIDSEGNITGSDTDGCVFGGSLSLLDTQYNMYDFRLIASNCGDFNGTYNGLAALMDDTEQNDTLAMGAEGPIYLIAGSIPRI